MRETACPYLLLASRAIRLQSAGPSHRKDPPHALGYTQQLDPLAGKIVWSPIWSTLLAGLPVSCCFGCWCRGAGWRRRLERPGALVAIIVAIAVYGMPADMACWSFASGALFGLLPVGWTIFNAMLLYNITVETGQFTIVRRSVAGISGDARSRRS